MFRRRGLWWMWYHGGVAVRGAAVGGARGTAEMVVWYCGGRMMARNPEKNGDAVTMVVFNLWDAMV